MELLSLRATHPEKRRLPWLPETWLKVVSIAFHLLLLLLLTHHFRAAAAKVRKDKLVARILTPYAPGHKSAPPQPPKPKIIPPKEPPKLALTKPEPPPPSAGDPTGEADVTVAMADFYPQPKPDLAVLPHGTKGDVILLITIDEQGKVVDGHIDQGLGHGLDEAVLAIIETWTFYPATKAGKPVPSEQQLLFHFERG